LICALLPLCFSLESAVAATTCFQVFDDRGSLKYEGRRAPVDLRDADSESWKQLRLRSEHLVWYATERCRSDRERATAASSVDRHADAKSNADLLLDRIPSFAGR